jgi:hypothetical protein
MQIKSLTQVSLSSYVSKLEVVPIFWGMAVIGLSSLQKDYMYVSTFGIQIEVNSAMYSDGNLELRQFYQQAIYKVQVGKDWINWRIGEINGQLDKLFAKHHVDSAAFITAFNPASVIQSEDWNKALDFYRNQKRS